MDTPDQNVSDLTRTGIYEGALLRAKAISETLTGVLGPERLARAQNGATLLIHPSLQLNLAFRKEIGLPVVLSAVNGQVMELLELASMPGDNGAFLGGLQEAQEYVKAKLPHTPLALTLQSNVPVELLKSPNDFQEILNAHKALLKPGGTAVLGFNVDESEKTGFIENAGSFVADGLKPQVSNAGAVDLGTHKDTVYLIFDLPKPQTERPNATPLK
jgi:hypothetical protein